LSWHYTIEKIDTRVQELAKAVVRRKQSLGEFRMAVGDIEGAAASAFDDSEWASVPSNGSYSAREQTVWLRGKVIIPETWAGQKLFLALELENAETLVWVDERPAQAIDLFHHNLLLCDSAQAGRTYTIALEAYTGLGDNWGVRQTEPLTVKIKQAELQWIDRDAERLYYDMNTALQAVKYLDPNSREYTVIVDALDQTTNLLDYSLGTESERFYNSVKAACCHLQENLYRKYHADPDFAPVLWCTGHAHIDTAWLWRLSHTRKKIGRTFSTALSLMEQYPEYRFTCSQPQQYQYLKQDYPEVYERIKAAVKRGQWEAVGGMWVESDCNVTSGESLVRQFLYGVRFFQEEFGVHTNVVWLPDVFGYSAAFPQIIKKAGMKYFMTIKIYWSQINKPPYQTFEWEGIDGTSVLTHYSPLGDYNAVMTPEQWRKNWDNYQQKSLNDSTLYIYGHGDGGGGPTRAMLETARRGADFPGMPKVKLSTAEEFFADLETQVAGNRQLPRWVGELYLEYHRGTYTSQGRNKRFNRQSEILLQTAEQISVLAEHLTGMQYPRNLLTEMWQLTLLNQFHDIIPGSSIHEVYDDSTKDYSRILSSGNEVVDGGLKALGKRVDAPAGSVLVYNPLSWKRNDVAELPRQSNLSGQNVTDMDGAEKTLIELSNVPALGYQTIVNEPARGSERAENELKISTSSLENRYFRIWLDGSGEITSIIDERTRREVIDGSAYCKGNALLMFEDKPIYWDAWDVDIFYQDKMSLLQDVSSIKVIEEGPIRGTVEIVRKFGRGSTLRQRISIYRNVDRIDFDTEVDWQERQTMLKVAFPVTVHSPRATYDIQFGNVERPIHWNTSWDWARFETCGHKWADLSEGDYGVSLLSDCKYGWDIRGNVMRLTLLKGPIAPDPDGDLGRHRFCYSLLPHSGDWRAAGTVQRAYELNVPVKSAVTAGGGTIPATGSLLSIREPNLIVETIKKAEDDSSMIVRLYETYGQRGVGHIQFSHAVKSAIEVNLLEVETEEIGDAPTIVDGDTLSFGYLPYEIKTFKVSW
jgi:alpha-mannosidase